LREEETYHGVPGGVAFLVRGWNPVLRGRWVGSKNLLFSSQRGVPVRLLWLAED